MRTPSRPRSCVIAILHVVLIVFIVLIGAPCAAASSERADADPPDAPTVVLPLTVAIMSEARGVADVVPRLLDEANRIWVKYGVRLETDVAPCARPLRIVIVDDPLPGTFADTEDNDRRGLGWITFLSPGKPRDVLYLSWKRTLALLADANSMHTSPEQMPDRLRETLLGRALGRTLAHELGHYLLASTSHARNGLMRRSYSAPQLFDQHVTGFDLDVDELRRLWTSETARANRGPEGDLS